MLLRMRLRLHTNPPTHYDSDYVSGYDSATLLGPLQRHCQTGMHPGYKVWGCKMSKILWPQRQIPLPTSCNWNHWCVWKEHPLFWVASKKLVNISGDPRESQWLQQRLSLAVIRGTLQEYWLVCNFVLILSVLYLVAFDALIRIVACHLPLSQCIVIAFRIPIPSVSFIVPLCSVTLPIDQLSYQSHSQDETTAWCYVPHSLKPLRHY